MGSYTYVLYNFNSISVDRVEQVRELKLHMDNKMTILKWILHKGCIVSKAFYSWGFVLRTCILFNDLMSAMSSNTLVPLGIQLKTFTKAIWNYCIVSRAISKCRLKKKEKKRFYCCLLASVGIRLKILKSIHNYINFLKMIIIWVLQW